MKLVFLGLATLGGSAMAAAVRKTKQESHRYSHKNVNSLQAKTQHGREAEAADAAEDPLLDDWVDAAPEDDEDEEEAGDPNDPFRTTCNIKNKKAANKEFNNILNEFQYGKFLKNKEYKFRLHVKGRTTYPFNWGVDQQGTSYNRVSYDPADPMNLKLTWQDPDSGAVTADHWLNVRPNSYDWSGGKCKVWAHRSTNENYLNFKYGTKKFTPKSAIIFTYNCDADPTADCMWDSGSTFQVVLVQNESGSIAKNFGRIVFSYANMANYLKEEPIGTRNPWFKDALDDTNQLAATMIENKKFIFWKFSEQPVSIYQPPVKTETCVGLEQCHCGPIQTAPELTWNLDIDNDVEFRGYCSQNDKYLNYPHKLKDREHICFVKCKSAACKGFDGKLKYPYALRFDTDGNQIFQTEVEATSFVCKVDEDNREDGPKWVRSVSAKENLLIKDMTYAADSMNRMAGERDASNCESKFRVDPLTRRQRIADRKNGVVSAEEVKSAKKEMIEWRRNCRAEAEAIAAEQKAMMEDAMNNMDRAASETTTLSMGFSCGHPEEWKDELQSVGMINPTNTKKDEPAWFHTNFDYANALWVCKDPSGNTIGSDDPVPYRGSCEFTCPTDSSLNYSREIECAYWHRAPGARTYLTGALKGFVRYTDFSRGDYNGPDGGWVCNAD